MLTFCTTKKYRNIYGKILTTRLGCLKFHNKSKKATNITVWKFFHYFLPIINYWGEGWGDWRAFVLNNLLNVLTNYQMNLPRQLETTQTDRPPHKPSVNLILIFSYYYLWKIIDAFVFLSLCKFQRFSCLESLLNELSKWEDWQIGRLLKVSGRIAKDLVDRWRFLCHKVVDFKKENNKNWVQTVEIVEVSVNDFLVNKFRSMIWRWNDAIRFRVIFRVVLE